MHALRRLGAITLCCAWAAMGLARPAAAAGIDQGGRIAFERTENGNSDIYTMNTDGTGVSRLTSAPAVDRQPSWSPDDETVVFSSNRAGSFDLWKKGADGLVQLTHGGAADRDPAWSPDGTEIAFVRAQSGHADLWLLDVATGAVSQATHDAAHDGHPGWLPDGTIVYDSDRSGQTEIWMVDPADGSTTQIDAGPGSNWSPSTSTNWQIAFVSDRTGKPSLWTMGGPGSTPVQRTDLVRANAAPAWSPYGINIALVRGAGANARIYQTNYAGQETQLTFGPGADGDPSWTFRDRAADDQTKANLEQALADATQIYDEDGSYAGVTSDRLAGIDPSLTWQTTSSTGPNVMSWAAGNSLFGGSYQEFGVAALTPSGLCFIVRDTKNWPGGELVLYGYTFTPANCTGTYARANASGEGWGF